jgi:hypothetical protein
VLKGFRLWPRPLAGQQQQCCASSGCRSTSGVKLNREPVAGGHYPCGSSNSSSCRSSLR